jgi:hypothetical protein
MSIIFLKKKTVITCPKQIHYKISVIFSFQSNISLPKKPILNIKYFNPIVTDCGNHITKQTNIKI